MDNRDPAAGKSFRVQMTVDRFETDSFTIEVFTDPHAPLGEQHQPHARILRIALSTERGSGQFAEMCACCAREFYDLLGQAIECAEHTDEAASPTQ